MSFPVSLPTPDWFIASSYGSQTRMPQGTFLFANGGDFYFVTQGEFNGSNDTLIYKSVNGASASAWSLIVTDSDRAGESICTTQFGSVIYFAINAPNGAGSNLCLFRFDMSTDSWLTDDTSGPFIVNDSGIKFVTAALSDGTITMVCNDQVTRNTGPTGTLQFVTWLAGSWSGPTTISSSNQMFPEWIVKENTTDRCHIFACEPTASGSVPPTGATGFGDLFHFSIESSGTVNTIQQLTTGGEYCYGVDAGGPSILADDSGMVFPVGTLISFTGTSEFDDPVRELHVFRAAPAANPTWSEETITIGAVNVCSLAALGFFAWPICYSVTVGSTIYVNYFIATHPAGPPYGPTGWTSSMFQVSTTSLVGGWTAPTTLFAEVADTVLSGKYDAKLGSGYGVMFMSTEMATFESGPIEDSLTDRFIWFGTAPPPGTFGNVFSTPHGTMTQGSANIFL